MKTLLQTLFFLLLVTQICLGQWYQQNSGTTANLNAVLFINESNGYVVGDSCIILFTSDGGVNWIKQSSATEFSLYGICFTTSENGFVVGGPSYWGGGGFPIMLHTTDAGSSWMTQSILPLPEGYINYIFFVDSNKGYALGGGCDFNGTLYSIVLKTMDDGVTWDSEVDSTMAPIIEGQFVDAEMGWALSSVPNEYGNYSAIYRTEDSGGTWSLILENYPGGPHGGGDPAVFDFYFKDSNNGIAIGDVVYRTTDGGDTWIDTIPLPGVTPKKIFAYENQITGVGYSGTICKSTDWGVTWILQNSGTTKSLNGVYFTDANNGWVVGDSGTILHTTNGGVTFVEEDKLGGVPTDFTLSQNYPNPFNPSTKIKYSVPQTAQVQIKIFDVLGNEIETLVNEEKPAGSYELTWNAGNLPGGVYFYQLRAGSFAETKKMILLK